MCQNKACEESQEWRMGLQRAFGDEEKGRRDEEVAAPIGSGREPISDRAQVLVEDLPMVFVCQYAARRGGEGRPGEERGTGVQWPGER